MASKTEVSVGSFEAVFSQVQLPFGLTVDEVRLTAANATIDKDPARLDLPNPGDVVAKVDEKHLESFLESQSPGGLKNFDVSLRDNKVFVKATVRMIFEIEANAVCTLRIVDQQFLYVDLESVDALGTNPTSLVEGQLAKINPVLDVSTFPLDIRLERVEIRDSALWLYGKAKQK